ncbi:MAG: SAM-dependent chlorinase/fluorinase [Magnetococcales bacterium]|nr:SAM-dependent chlorinase/fluorinase [Magnetococcales bacterium]
MNIPFVLLTDFGTSDPYVGQVKGVLHRYAPEARIIDLYHDLPPFSIASGAWLLERCLPIMPAPSIWLCVVDPGVGSSRRGLAISSGISFYVGPDNGLLTPIFQNADWQAVSLPRNAHAAPTFHGRDLFAPVAARLHNGETLENLGTPVHDPVRCNDPGWSVVAGGFDATIMLSDRYGNLITALPKSVVAGKTLRGTIHGQACGTLVNTFASVPLGEAALVAGGFGTIEIIVNQGSAQHRFNAQTGERVHFTVDA